MDKIKTAKPIVSEDPLKKQVGGSHYKTMAIQPVEYIMANNLPFCEASIVKYASRWRDKGGIEDLRKVIHYAEILIAEAKKEKAKAENK